MQMATKYRIVKLVNDPRRVGRSFDYVYSIQKKTWFGWKEVDWHYTEGHARGILHRKILLSEQKDEVIEEVEV